MLGEATGNDASGVAAFVLGVMGSWGALPQ
jgi:hypothetical protein